MQERWPADTGRLLGLGLLQDHPAVISTFLTMWEVSSWQNGQP